MGAAPLAEDEARRLAAVEQLGILDTGAEQALDDLVLLASEICGAPMALVTIIDAKRQWFKARVGVELAETPREHAFCAHTILGDELLVVPDARQDARFADNPFVTGEAGVRFYAGAPLRLPSGFAVGSLCVVDTKPRALCERERAALHALQRQAETHIALRAKSVALRAANEALARAQRNHAQRVRYLVHDMKNALAVIDANANMLLRQPPDPDEASSIAAHLLDVNRTLAQLVFDTLDVGTTELGGALRLVRARFPLDALFAPLAAAFAVRLAARDLALRAPPLDLGAFVWGDQSLLRRVVQNYVDNACRHAPRGTEIVLSAECAPEGSTVRVSDRGPGVPEGTREVIFEPGVQGATEDPYTRGIGLAFCRAAVAAHGGRAWVEPHGAVGSSFCFFVPGEPT